MSKIAELMNVSHHLSPKDSAAMAVQIADYVDRIAMKKGEFAKVANAIKEVFSAKGELAPEVLKGRIAKIDKMRDLTSTTKSSLKERLTSLVEIYEEPELWIENSAQFPALKRFLVETVQKKAEQLIHLSSGEKKRYLNDQGAVQKQSRDHQAVMQLAMRNRGSEKSTLSSLQQLEEFAFRDFIEDNDLQNRRDFAVPLNEDANLLRFMAKDPEYNGIFAELPNLFKTSKIAALILIAESVKQISDFEPRLQRDRDVLLIAADRAEDPDQLMSEELDYGVLVEEDLSHYEEVMLEDLIVEHGCSALRNRSLPLAEDTHLLRALVVHPVLSFALKGVLTLFANSQTAAEILLSAKIKDLSEFGPTVRSNPKIVLTALQHDPEALRDASDELKASKDFVLAAVRQNGLSLRFCPEIFKNDRAVALAACRQNPKALQFTGAKFRAGFGFSKMLFQVQWKLSTLISGLKNLLISPLRRSSQDV